jgi:protein gp37
MGEATKIEWAHHTFNTWWGCTKVSPACQFCYAEAWAKRMGYEVWGANAERRFFLKDAHWNEPLKWNAKAETAGERRRVFCSSMADVFELHPDPNIGAAMDDARARLWGLLRRTPALDWLLLTKRPENLAAMLPGDWDEGYPNVWLGTTVENQEWAGKRIPYLLAVPAAVRFLSVEPMLGAVDLSFWIQRCSECGAEPALDWRFTGTEWQHQHEYPAGHMPAEADPDSIHWVICGGESGAHARPMHPDWAHGLRDQCAAAGIAFHFKQWGEWKPISEMPEAEHSALYRPNRPAKEHEDQEQLNEVCGRHCTVGTRAIQYDGGDGYQRIDGYPGYLTFRVGKKAAGRLLDGREWNEVPEMVTAGGAR